MNPRGLNYLRWEIREQNPECRIGEEAGTVIVPLESHRKRVLSNSLSLGTIGSIFSALFSAFGVSAAVKVNPVASAIFSVIAAIGWFFSIRMLRHVRDLRNENESWRLLLKRFFFPWKEGGLDEVY